MTLDKFLSKTRIEGVCWIWTDACNKTSGYGRVKGANRKEMQAQEMSWLLHHGAIPPEQPHVLQKCRNKACVNPVHLYLAEMREGNLEEAFFARIQKTDSCWIWTGTINARGYGYLEVCQWHGDKKQRISHRASRLSWKIHFGDPGDAYVCHNCPGGDNSLCVNPDHLWLGTQYDNMQDMANKGRGKYPKGEEHGEAKLTESKVRDIRREYAKGYVSYEALGRKHGVTKGAIYRVVQRKSWAHVV